MYGDYGYCFNEAEEGVGSILLTENECEVTEVVPGHNDYRLSNSADHCCTLPEVITASQTSPVRFMTSHSDCTNTATDAKDTDWSQDLPGHVDTMSVVRSAKSGHVDVAVCTSADNEISAREREENDGSDSSRSEVDETKSFMNPYRIVREGHQGIDWSELAAARAEMQSSVDATSRSDNDVQSWTSDDEEPELRDLIVDSSTEMVESDTSGDYEEDTREDNCDDQPEETRERNSLIVNGNGTFEEVCLSSSTYYFACPGKDDGR